MKGCVADHCAHICERGIIFSQLGINVNPTPTVPHPKLSLSLLFFLAKIEKIFSDSSPSQVAIYPKLGKTDSTRAYMRVAIRDASSRNR
jgi:hypothetical protein